jgi:hypothetical protein
VPEYYILLLLLLLLQEIRGFHSGVAEDSNFMGRDGLLIGIYRRFGELRYRRRQELHSSRTVGWAVQNKKKRTYLEDRNRKVSRNLGNICKSTQRRMRGQQIIHHRHRHRHSEELIGTT